MDVTRASCCTYALVHRPVDETIKIVAEAGFKKIDLLGQAPHLSLDPAETDPAKIKTLAQTHGLWIANLGTYVGGGFTNPDPAIQTREFARVQRAIDLAVFLGARSIRFFRVSAAEDDAAFLERLALWGKRCAEYAAEKKILLGIENHGGAITGSPEMLKRLFDQIGSPYLGLLYDPCNYVQKNVDYRAALESLKDHLVHVHLKDAVSAPAFQRVMLGAGEIDFRWIVERLDALGYRGDFALEYELTEPPAEQGLAQWLATYAAL